MFFVALLEYFRGDIMENNSKKKPNRIKKSLNISLSENDKKYIIEKADSLGFNSVSAFLLDCARTYYRLEVDMSVYNKLSREINYIGKNINSFVRQVFSDGVYTSSDIKDLSKKQDQIQKIISEEFSRLINLEKNFSSKSFNMSDTEEVIKLMTQNNIKIPDNIILEGVYEDIRNNFLYVIKLLEESPEGFEQEAEYVTEYIYSHAFTDFDKNEVINLSNDIFKYCEDLKFKFISGKSYFDDSDWFKLRSILDKYEKKEV